MTIPHDDGVIRFTPEALREMSKVVEALRMQWICDVDGSGATPTAIQHYMQSLCYLELAQRELALAWLQQAAAIAKSVREHAD